MGSSCSRYSFSRSSSRKVLTENAAPIANLDDTLNQSSYSVPPQQSVQPSSQLRLKPSAKSQYWSSGSTGTVTERFQTKTLKLNSPISDLVRLPPGVNEYAWIYDKAQFFTEECQLLWESVSDFCNPRTCPEMTAGPHYTYLWTDQYTREPVSMPACNYISNVFIWISDEFNSKEFTQIPNGVYPEDFMHIMQIVFKKLFRVYAHVYHHHLEEFVKRDAEVHLNTSFKYFGMFVREFGLITKKEEAPLRKLLQQLVELDDRDLPRTR
ncbi:hypothetical protein WA538_002232 [Blastocystis sp. DL]